MKTIVFDIDGTWSLDPNCFTLVASLFRDHGWRVIILSGSYQPVDKLQRLRLYPQYEVHIANGLNKKDWLKQYLGITECVFVDNDPSSIIPILKDDLE